MNIALISVIVPIYNAEKYMKKCIDSILSQTLEDIEIILVNDGSSDNSGKISDEYKKIDSRVVVIHQENSGPSTARNKGISIATGKYIGFVDSDDYIEPTMYEELYNIANKNNIELAMCSYSEKYIYNNELIVVKANLESNKIYSKSEINEKIISTFVKNDNHGYYSLCNKIYLREWLLDSNIILDVDREHGEDWWFNINIISNINSFVYIDKQLYNYIHINSNSLIFKYRENQFDLFLDGRLKMKKIVPKQYMDEKEFNQRFVYEFSSYIIRTMKEIDNRKRRKELIYGVVNNNEVRECCNDVSGLPIYFTVPTLLIKYRLKSLAALIYQVISMMI